MWSVRKNGGVESACKPGSVVDNHSSGMCVTTHLKRPTRERCGPHQCSPIWSCSEWGLPCHPCYQGRGALLPHHFTLTCVLRPSAVYFLRHFPSAHAAQALPGTLPYGARTFLQRENPPAIIGPTPGGSLGSLLLGFKSKQQIPI